MTDKDIERCGDCACFHPPTDLCTYRRERVDYMQEKCEFFIWD